MGAYEDPAPGESKREKELPRPGPRPQPQVWDDTAYTGATRECLDRGATSREIPDPSGDLPSRPTLPRNEILEKPGA